mmetsp:Transcript_22635/g.33527  ORF Transcript_22635/g.33527 Transcript_22635/m.33527 type:complete len:201 (+) Transcript_22635:1408-2010(+)
MSEVTDVSTIYLCRDGTAIIVGMGMLEVIILFRNLNSIYNPTNSPNSNINSSSSSRFMEAFINKWRISRIFLTRTRSQIQIHIPVMHLLHKESKLQERKVTIRFHHPHLLQPMQVVYIILELQLTRSPHPHLLGHTTMLHILTPQIILSIHRRMSIHKHPIMSSNQVKIAMSMILIQSTTTILDNHDNKGNSFTKFDLLL